MEVLGLVLDKLEVLGLVLDKLEVLGLDVSNPKVSRNTSSLRPNLRSDGQKWPLRALALVGYRGIIYHILYLLYCLQGQALHAWIP